MIISHRRTFIVLFISLLVLVPCILTVGILSYQPFHNVDWKQSINGQIGQVMVEKSGIYVANYSFTPSGKTVDDNYSFSVYSINPTDGRINWITPPMVFSGIYSIFNQINNYRGVKMWLINDTLYIGDFNYFGTAQSAVKNYTIYTYNAVTGDELGVQTVTFDSYLENITNNSLTANSVQIVGSRMFITFEFVTSHLKKFSAAYSAYIYNFSFVFQSYEIEKQKYSLVLNTSTQLPEYFSTSKIPLNIEVSAPVGITVANLDIAPENIVINDNTGNITFMNFSYNSVFADNGGIFFGKMSNTSISVYKMSSFSKLPIEIFNYSIRNLNTTPPNFVDFSLHKISNGNFLIELKTLNTQYILDLNKNGELLWQFNTPFSGYSNTQATYGGTNELLISFVRSEVTQLFTQQALIYILNTSSGAVIWKDNYITSANPSGYRNFLAPYYFEGQYAVFDQKVLFKFEGGLELSNLPN